MISKNKLGIVVGGFLGLWHLVWALAVAFGFAQSLLNFVFRIHFIEPPYVIAPFRPELAVALIVITSILGYLIGAVLAAIWNWLHAGS